MEKWYVACKKADFEALGKKWNVNPLIPRILRNRDITEEAEMERFLYGGLSDLYSPFLLKDMKKGIEIISECIKKQNRIRIIGDYDVDGICASYILKQGLEVAGGMADVVIPHRIYDGYGLNPSIIEQADRDGIDFCVTCDNGIAAIDAIDLAKQKGMAVVVTDHHEVTKDENGEEILPSADAVIDPKQRECEYPFADICGAVVAYKLIEGLLQEMGLKKPEAFFSKLLQAAAMATVCDVMPLISENRILVKEGLKAINYAPLVGIEALMGVNGIEPGRVTAYHFGFVLGPCLNASGRLDAAYHGLELLLCEKKEEAARRAAKLKALNEERKQMTLEGVEQAKEYLEKNHMEQDKILVIYLPECHESLAGIIAGRIRDLEEKPVLVITKGENCLKGSARSIEAYSIYEGLKKCDKFLLKFGGHKAAAGFSLEEENLENLRLTLNSQCELKEADFVKKIMIDAPMPFSYVNLPLAKQLEQLEPFGTANPKPLFARKKVELLKAVRIGAGKQFARYKVQDEDGEIRDLMCFSQTEDVEKLLVEIYGKEAVKELYLGTAKGLFLSVTYQIGINRYQGQESVQFILKNFCIPS